jgi:hypothetical protein
MIEQAAHIAQPLLTLPLIRATRRNHALEHATITVLSTRLRNLRIAGRSDHNGFILIGDVPSESIEQAAEDALNRLRNGERKLAIHPNCGTNLVTTAFMTSIAAMVGLTGAGKRDYAGRLPLVMALVMAAGFVSQPLSLKLQEHITTDGNPGNLEIVDITRSELRLPFGDRALILHRVNTYTP